MRRFLARRWPWLVSTLVHAVVLTAIAFNLLDTNSKAASVPAQIEMALAPEIAPPAIPQPDQAKPVETPRQEVAEVKPEDAVNEQRPEEVRAVEAIPLAEPMPELAEAQPVIPAEVKPVPPPPPPKPAIKPPAPVIARTPTPPAPPVETPVQAAPAPAAALVPPQLASLPPMAGRPGADADYFAVVLAWLEKHKEYPRQAQIRRMQGTAVLHFELDRQGHVLSYRLDRSSGYPELDREVEEMIRRAAPLPPMPVDMVQARVELVVPVQFRLR